MSEKIKKVPFRMCVGCRNRAEKKELVRVVRMPDGSVHIDLRGKMSGRGAYICKSRECLDKALKSRAIDRALQITLDDETKMRLMEEIE